jgi:uncharacterized lipoprotein YddW (UPF0748 family)
MPRRLLCCLLAAALTGGLHPRLASAADPPAVAREYRGVWVATVANIDWPSRPGLPAGEQKQELLAVLDRCKELNLNAVVFQVRPMCDALYESKLEPWSSFLTGTQGKSPGYDPLAFAVEESHKRGLELHAWFNPYRAWSPSAKGGPADNHLVKTRPDLAKEYGKHHWLNPTNKEVQDHSLAVMLDVVKRYDVDGIHMDDYFYPYPEVDADKKEIPFPDDDTWEAYRKAGGTLARDDWRRDAVNRFVKRLYEETHRAKPWVKVGISPFGIWRPGHPPGIAGFDQYAKLYADARLWLNEGWVDYWTPQLYWPIKQEKQSYPKLLAWWAGENAKGRHLWPGLYTGRHAGPEIVDQVKATRDQKGATGNVHFSMKTLVRNTNSVADLLKDAYKEPALVPASPWLGDKKPARPGVQNVGDERTNLLLTGGEGTRVFVVRSATADGWATRIEPAVRQGVGSADFGFGRPPARVVVTAVDRFGTESTPAEWKP